MRVTRRLIVCLAVAMTAAGCAQRVQMVPVSAAAPPPAPAAQGIDNVIYGAGPAGGGIAPASYAAPSRGVFSGPGYAAAAPFGSAAMAPAAPVAPLPAYGAAGPAPFYASAAPGRVAPAPVAYVPPPAIMAPAPAMQTYTLDSGDRLRVVVFGQEGLTNSFLLDASGQIQMPLIGQVPARGLTTEQLSERIAGMLRQGFVREPHVAVEVEAYRPFFILGEVLAPGQYPYVANMTAQTAVAIAGGFGPRAYHKQVTVTHVVGGQVYCFEVPMTYGVRPGDTIQVQERWF
jgi:protein involved in polysaccharide export with SLBB domain